jgi:hypothetical protein
MTRIAIFRFSTKIFLTRALWLLGWVWLASGPLMAQTRKGLHYTAEELAVWRQRANATATTGTTNYRVVSDVIPNSPGDWTRITNNANRFFNNTANARVNDRYTTYYNSSGYVPRSGQTGYSSTQDPTSNGLLIRDAAFYSLIKENQSYANLVKTELLVMAADPYLQFNQTSRWGTTSPNNLRDLNPGFIIAEWLTRLLYAYDYIKETVTDPAERTILDNWFFEAANYMRYNYEADLTGLFGTTPNADGFYNLKDNQQDAGSGWLMYLGGPAARKTSRYFNNRRLDMISFVGLAGVFLADVTSLSTTSGASFGLPLSSLSLPFRVNSKRFFKDFIRYGIYPTGYFVDFLRGITDLNPRKAFVYSVNDTMIALADAFARTGDSELYDFVTEQGTTATDNGGNSLDATASTDGTKKGLKMHIKAMLELRNRTKEIYSGNYGILYNTSATATLPNATVPYTALSAAGGWSTNSTNAAKTAFRRYNNTGWTTSVRALYNTASGAKFPDKTIAWNATSAPGGTDSQGNPIPSWTNTYSASAVRKCTRSDLDTDGWFEEEVSQQLPVKNGNQNYRIDGIDRQPEMPNVDDIIYSVANLYYKDSYIFDSYTRKPSVAPLAYTVPPDKVQYAGSKPVWGGLGQYPAILFMFGQMEDNPANPFLPPTVSLTYPGNNATFGAPASITLTANAAATSTNGVILKVEFYDGTSKLGEDLTSPYSYIWNNPSLGAHTITAKAITKLGVSKTSNPVALTVGPALTLLEAETIYTKVTDPDNDVNQITCTGTLSGAKAVQLTDAGDAIRLTFNITQTGIYRIGVHGRSGYSGSPTAYWPNGHSFTVNGTAQTFTGDASTLSTLSTCMGNSYWGTMYSGNLQLNAGANNIVVTSNGGYRGIDHLTIEFVTNGIGARLASEAKETLPTLMAFPNPFQDQITVDLGESAAGTYQISLTDALGRSYYAHEHQLKDHQTQVVIPLSGKSLSSGLYLLQLNNGGKSLPKVLKLIKQE